MFFPVGFVHDKCRIVGAGVAAVFSVSVSWTPTTRVSPAPLSPDQQEKLRQSWLDSQRTTAGLGPMTYPAVVRWINPNETASVLVPCMKSKGFAVTGDASGSGLNSQVDPSQNQPFARAQLECNAMYPLDPRWSMTPTTDQKRVIYEYYSQFVIPCVRKHGLTIRNLPTEAVWVANPQPLQDYPFQNDEIMVACPINVPPSAYLGQG